MLILDLKEKARHKKFIYILEKHSSLLKLFFIPSFDILSFHIQNRSVTDLWEVLHQSLWILSFFKEETFLKKETEIEV